MRRVPTLAFPLVYFVHLLDERFWPPGTANWVTANTSLHFTNDAWLYVNIASMAVMVLVTALMTKGSLPKGTEVAIATHLGLHGATRVLATVFSDSIAPGVATGVLLCLPVSAMVLVRGFQLFPRTTFVQAITIGVLSFQPLLHWLLHSLL